MKHYTTTEWVPMDHFSVCSSKYTVWGVHCENHKPQCLITQVVHKSHMIMAGLVLCVQAVSVQFTPWVSLGAREPARIITHCFLVMMQLHVIFSTACTFRRLATIQLESSGEPWVSWYDYCGNLRTKRLHHNVIKNVGHWLAQLLLSETNSDIRGICLYVYTQHHTYMQHHSPRPPET